MCNIGQARGRKPRDPIRSVRVQLFKWLSRFKKAHGINRVRLHGEGDEADLVPVATVRTELPPILTDTPLNKIYNFDETRK